MLNGERDNKVSKNETVIPLPVTTYLLKLRRMCSYCHVNTCI